MTGRLNGFAHRPPAIDPWKAWEDLAARALSAAAQPSPEGLFALAGERKLAGRVPFPLVGHSAQLPAQQLLALAGFLGNHDVMPERLPILCRLLAAHADAVRELLQHGREAQAAIDEAFQRRSGG